MKYWVLLPLLLIFSSSFGQKPESKVASLERILSHDLSELWTTPKVYGEEATFERQEPLGIIGEQYQRLYIHFTSVIKNPLKQTEYLIYGKTRVKNNICEFQGSIEIKEAYTFFMKDISELEQGYITGTYTFYENPKEKGSGILTGTFRSDFFIDAGKAIRYNGLIFQADAFRNNQFEGIWTSYSTDKSKKCNWGDYRIPDCSDLDMGAGEFSPSDKYLSMGWENYRRAHFYFEGNEEWKKAYALEMKEWWKD